MRVLDASGSFESSKTPSIQAASRKRKEQKDESTEHRNKQLQRKKLSTRLLKKVLLFRGEEATVTKLVILLFCFFREPTDCLISSNCLQTELNFWKAWGIDFFPSATKQDKSTSARGKMDTYLLTIVPTACRQRRSHGIGTAYAGIAQSAQAYARFAKGWGQICQGPSLLVQPMMMTFQGEPMLT